MNMYKYAMNVHECAQICSKYAMNMHKICNDMQEYAIVYAKKYTYFGVRISGTVGRVGNVLSFMPKVLGSNPAWPSCIFCIFCIF